MVVLGYLFFYQVVRSEKTLKNMPNFGRKGGDIYDDQDEQEGLYAC